MNKIRIDDKIKIENGMYPLKNNINNNISSVPLNKESKNFVQSSDKLNNENSDYFLHVINNAKHVEFHNKNFLDKNYIQKNSNEKNNENENIRKMNFSEIMINYHRPLPNNNNIYFSDFSENKNNHVNLKLKNQQQNSTFENILAHTNDIVKKNSILSKNHSVSSSFRSNSDDSYNQRSIDKNDNIPANNKHFNKQISDFIGKKESDLLHFNNNHLSITKVDEQNKDQNGIAEFLNNPIKLISPDHLELINNAPLINKRKKRMSKFIFPSNLNHEFELSNKVNYADFSLNIFNRENRFRKIVFKLIHNSIFDKVILLLILINSIILTISLNFSLASSDKFDIFDFMDIFFLLIYSIEGFLKITALGFIEGKRAYLKNKWNILDFFVVMLSLISWYPTFKNSPFFKVFRMLRPIRTISFFPGLKILLTMLGESLKEMVSLFILMLFFFILFGVFGTAIWSSLLTYRCRTSVSPQNGFLEVYQNSNQICGGSYKCLNNSTCLSITEFYDKKAFFFSPKLNLYQEQNIPDLNYGYTNFDNIFYAILTIFQVMTLEGWTSIMFIFQNGYNYYSAALYFISVVVLMNYFVLNFTIAIMMNTCRNLTFNNDVVENKKKKNTNDEEDPINLKNKNKQIIEDDSKNVMKLKLYNFIIYIKRIFKFIRNIKLFKKYDVKDCVYNYKNKKNNSNNFKSNSDLLLKNRSESKLSNQKNDNETIVENVYPLKYKQNPKFLFHKRLKIFFYCFVISKQPIFRFLIYLMICTNVFILSLNDILASDESLKIYEMINNILIIVLSVEVVLKILGMGLINYFKKYNNILDVIITGLSIYELNTLKKSSFGLLRIVRLYRLIKLVKNWKTLSIIIKCFQYTMKEISHYLILISIMTYVYALIGMTIFKDKLKFDSDNKYNEKFGVSPFLNFDNIYIAFISVFSLLIGDNWQNLMYDCLRSESIDKFSVYVYFLSVIILLNIVMMNLVIAFLVFNFESARKRYIYEEQMREWLLDQKNQKIKRSYSFSFLNNLKIRKILKDEEMAHYFDFVKRNKKKSQKNLLEVNQFTMFVKDNQIRDVNTDKILDFSRKEDYDQYFVKNPDAYLKDHIYKPQKKEKLKKLLRLNTSFSNPFNYFSNIKQVNINVDSSDKSVMNSDRTKSEKLYFELIDKKSLEQILKIRRKTVAINLKKEINDEEENSLDIMSYNGNSKKSNDSNHTNNIPHRQLSPFAANKGNEGLDIIAENNQEKVNLISNVQSNNLDAYKINLNVNHPHSGFYPCSNNINKDIFVNKKNLYYSNNQDPLIKENSNRECNLRIKRGNKFKNEKESYLNRLNSNYTYTTNTSSNLKSEMKVNIDSITPDPNLETLTLIKQNLFLTSSSDDMRCNPNHLNIKAGFDYLNINHMLTNQKRSNSSPNFKTSYLQKVPEALVLFSNKLLRRYTSFKEEKKNQQAQKDFIFKAQAKRSNQSIVTNNTPKFINQRIKESKDEKNACNQNIEKRTNFNKYKIKKMPSKTSKVIHSIQQREGMINNEFCGKDYSIKLVKFEKEFNKNNIRNDQDYVQQPLIYQNLFNNDSDKINFKNEKNNNYINDEKSFHENIVEEINEYKKIFKSTYNPDLNNYKNSYNNYQNIMENESKLDSKSNNAIEAIMKTENSIFSETKKSLLNQERNFNLSSLNKKNENNHDYNDKFKLNNYLSEIHEEDHTSNSRIMNDSSINKNQTNILLEKQNLEDYKAAAIFHKSRTHFLQNTYKRKNPCSTILLYLSESSLFIFHYNMRIRRLLILLINRQWFENLTIWVIFSSCIILIFESPYRDPNSTFSKAIRLADHIFTFIFFFEMIAKIIAYGLIFDRVNSLENILENFGNADSSSEDEFETKKIKKYGTNLFDNKLYFKPKTQGTVSKIAKIGNNLRSIRKSIFVRESSRKSLFNVNIDQLANNSSYDSIKRKNLGINSPNIKRKKYSQYSVKNLNQNNFSSVKAKKKFNSSIIMVNTPKNLCKDNSNKRPELGINSIREKFVLQKVNSSREKRMENKNHLNKKTDPYQVKIFESDKIIVSKDSSSYENRNVSNSSCSRVKVHTSSFLKYLSNNLNKDSYNIKSSISKIPIKNFNRKKSDCHKSKSNPQDKELLNSESRENSDSQIKKQQYALSECENGKNLNIKENDKNENVLEKYENISESEKYSFSRTEIKKIILADNKTQIQKAVLLKKSTQEINKEYTNLKLNDVNKPINTEKLNSLDNSSNNIACMSAVKEEAQTFSNIYGVDKENCNLRQDENNNIRNKIPNKNLLISKNYTRSTNGTSNKHILIAKENPNNSILKNFKTKNYMENKNVEKVLSFKNILLGGANKIDKMDQEENLKKLMKKAYLRDFFNIIDFVVIISSLIYFFDSNEEVQTKNFFQINKNLNFSLQGVRSLRALRPLRIINKLEELKIVVYCLIMSTGSIFYMFLIGFFVLFIYALIGLNLFHGTLGICSNQLYLNRKSCIDNNFEWTPNIVTFDTIGSSMNTLFQMATTSGWVDIMKITIEKNESNFISIYFVSFMVIGAIFIMNLAVTVIVDNFSLINNRAEGISILTEDQQNWVRTMKCFLKYKPIPHFDKKSMSNVRKFSFELVNKKFFNIFINTLILINVLFLFSQYDRSGQILTDIQSYFFYFSTFCFNLEMLCKIVAYKRFYFIDNWNKFDFIVVILSNISIVLNIIRYFNNLKVNNSVNENSQLILGDKFNLISVLIRGIRILRILRLINLNEHLKSYFYTFVVLFPSLANIGSLILIILTIYAVIGMNFFGTIMPGNVINENKNFQDFTSSILSLIGVTTGDNWNDLMNELSISKDDCKDNQTYQELITDGPRGCGGMISYGFFISFILVNNMVIFNLFIAVVVESFMNNTEKIDEVIDNKKITQFYEIWGKYDKEINYKIEPWEFVLLMLEMDEPFGIKKEYFHDPGKNQNYYSGNIYISHDCKHFADDKMCIKALKFLNIESRDKYIHIIDAIKIICKRAVIDKSEYKINNVEIDHKLFNKNLNKKFFSYNKQYKKYISESLTENSAISVAKNVIRKFLRKWRESKDKEKQSQIKPIINYG